MSYLDDASLVMIPSGYKAGTVFSVKPTDGSGDLAFTRSNDTATRVGPDWLIEKVRTNLLLQSNTFSTTWTNSNSTDAGGQADKDGGTTAWKIDKTAASGYIRQAISQSGVQTFSVYAKAGTLNWMRLIADGGTSTPSTWFDLQNGVVGAADFFTIDAKIEAAGNGYYRCSISYEVGTISGVRIYPADDNNDVSGTSGNILIQDAQLETGDIATDYIPTTTTAVSVGPVANVPRLDYLGSSCPRLLLEPQRTNLALFSESFDNAAWTKTNASVTANALTSPDGYTNADNLIENTASGVHLIQQAAGGFGIATYAVSVFAKSVSGNRYLQIWNGNATNAAVWARFDLENGTVTQSNGIAGTGYSISSATITSYGNGWYRCAIATSKLNTTGANTIQFRLSQISTGVESNVYTGDGVSSISLYGAQIEQSATYPTSLIPTLSAAVTRGADAASKTGISSLIGQTEGVLFVDFVPQNNPIASTQQWLMFLGSGGFYIAIHTTSNGKIRGNVANSTDQCVIDTTYSFVAGTRYKCALAYKANDFAFYVNGVLQGTDTSGTIPAVSTIQNNYNTTAANSTNAVWNQALLFKTRLTNDQLAELTTL